MRADADDFPLLAENSSAGLGARVPADINVTMDGMVRPASGGMSVTFGDPRHLPPHLRPATYGGRGRNPLWRIQAGDFGPHLRIRIDPDNEHHGLVEPARTMSWEEYRSHLASSRRAWVLWGA